MKRFYIFLSLLFAILAFGDKVCRQTLANGGFEANSTYPGTGWTAEDNSFTFGTGTISTSAPRTGVNNYQSPNFSNYSGGTYYYGDLIQRA